MCKIMSIYFGNYRLYWLDRTTIKSSSANGLDIKSHVITGGAKKAFIYKVIVL